MTNLNYLKKLELVDLMLEDNDAKFLLDEVCNQCCLQLHTLILINTTKETLPLLHPGVFLNLYVCYVETRVFEISHFHLTPMPNTNATSAPTTT